VTKAWSESEQRAIVDAATVMVLRWPEIDQATKVEGAVWYPQRWEFCQRVWPEHPERVAACLAATSPQTTWNVNVAWTLKAVAAWQAGEQVPAIGTLSMRDKAWRVLAGDDPVPVLNGPKITDFYLSIAGHTDRPVIDRWAARAAGFELPANQGIGARLYRLISEAYSLAARQLDVPARTLQATLWIDKRGAAE
jgi:hypothetical protein